MTELGFVVHIRSKSGLHTYWALMRRGTLCQCLEGAGRGMWPVYLRRTPWKFYFWHEKEHAAAYSPQFHLNILLVTCAGLALTDLWFESRSSPNCLCMQFWQKKKSVFLTINSEKSIGISFKEDIATWRAAVCVGDLCWLVFLLLCCFVLASGGQASPLFLQCLFRVKLWLLTVLDRLDCLARCTLPVLSNKRSAYGPSI